MALNPKLSNAAANAEVDALTALLNTGYLRLYTTAQATDADTALGAQTKVAELRFGNPAFGAGVAGVATANAITSDTSAPAAGTAVWYRCLKSDGSTVVCDGSVGTSGANLNLNSNVISLGAQVDVTSFTLTASKA